MSNRRRNRRHPKGPRKGLLGKARAQMKLAANITEEQDWYLDTPDVRLTRIFGVVVLLHLIAVGGIFAFKMIDKAADTSAVKISSARQEMPDAVQERRATAAQVPVAVPVDAPARHAPAAPLRRDPAKGDQYKVQAGDTLPEIAKSLGVTPEALRSANAIVSDNELYPGRWLTVPGKSAAAAVPVAQPVVATPAAAAPAAPDKAPAPNRPREYQVKAGDTPWAIARQFNVPFNRLMSENGITNAQSLQIGQKLRIPAE